MSNSEDRLAIEFISVLGMPPVEFVHFAADQGVGKIGLALSPISANPHGYPAWSLRDDAALRRDFIAASKDRNVAISLGEGFLIRPGADIGNMAADMDLMVELGAERVNGLSISDDRAFTRDQVGAFAEMADARGLQAVLEFMPMGAVNSLGAAVSLVEEVGAPNLGVLVDFMHLMRSGGSPAELAAVAPDLIGYAQICDVPLVATNPNYGEEARDNRLSLGEGGLPLADLIAALPANVVVGLEAPMSDRATAGQGPAERLAPAIAYTRNLLESVAVA